MTVSPDMHALVHPEIAEALAAMPFDIGAALGSLSHESVGALRAGFAAAPPVPVADGVSREDHDIVGTDGVRVRVYRPTGATDAMPCLYWMHGGGLVLGGYEMADSDFNRWCLELGCIGVSVEYRLAPETPYPGPLDDCYAGLAWVHKNAELLGVDPTRIGIGGASAGGGLAASLALRARDQGEYSVSFQLLVYPMIDDRQVTVSSQRDELVWPPAANAYGWSAYLGDRKGTADVPSYAAASRETNLADLPPTMIIVGALDGFADEDTDYATRLRHAGVPTEFHIYAGAPHGFNDLMPTASVSIRANNDIAEWLSRHL